MSDYNLMPGSGFILASMERAADAYDAALCMAWENLSDADVPDGVGWEVAESEQDRDGAFVIVFRDGGGLEYTTTVDPWGIHDDDEPPSWWD